ncbi:hypothetical protein [Paenirhodobacter populi]|uniref:Uncharacterized protein n=1 Tax=Paenirhodobacter populi TaxID=2306993 RepID=A0A443JLQ4_9RHOB|nr:hypothetical protein [Sinirhodobacter populi]RWR21136.1 hypothetical protein D2T30_09845 [Sinirhodobacter populi]
MSELDLWCAVLLSAVDDALLGPSSRDPAHRALQAQIIEHARSYLTTPSKDLSTVCSLAGIDMPCLIDRMRVQIAQAPSVDELLGQKRKTSLNAITKKPKPPKPKRTAETYTYNGETLTIRQWSEKTGIRCDTIRGRINRGWPIGEAVTMTKQEAAERESIRRHKTTKIRHKRSSPGIAPTLYEHNGERLSLSDWSIRTGIKKVTLYARLMKGWPMEDVLRPDNLRGRTLITA